MAAPDAFFFNIQMANNFPTGNPPVNTFLNTWISNGLGQTSSCMRFTGGIGASQDSAQFDITDHGVTPASSGWISWLQDGADMTSSTGQTPIIISGPTTDLLRIRAASGDIWAFDYYDGSTWQQIGANVSVPLIDDPSKFDIFYNIADSGGEFSIYVNGAASPLRTFTGDTLLTADSTIQKFAAYAPDSTTSNDNFYVACIIFDSTDTRDLYADETFTLDAGERWNDWPSRDETDVDEGLGGVATTIGSTANTSTPGDRVTWDMNDAQDALGTLTVEAVTILWSTAAQSPDPLYLKPILAKNLGASAVDSSFETYEHPGPGQRPADLTGATIEMLWATWDTDPGASLTPTYTNNAYGRGNRTDIITASTTALVQGGTISNSVDGQTDFDTSDSWYFTGGQTVTGLEIKWDFGVDETLIVDEVLWRQSQISTHGTWKVQGSNDDAAWTDLSSNFTLGDATDQFIDLDLQTGSLAFRYIRLLGVSGTTSQTPWLTEVEFRVADTEGLDWTASSFDSYEIGFIALATP